MKLDDLDQYLNPGLILTVKGREYTVPLPSAELGLWCRRGTVAMGDINAASTDAEMQAAVDRMQQLPALPGEDLTMSQRMLGTAYAEMVADGVEDPYIEFCGHTAYIWIIAGEEAAARWWQSGGRPEAQGPPNRAARRAVAKAGATSTGEAGGTPSPASTSGTTSRRKSGRRRKPQS